MNVCLCLFGKGGAEGGPCLVPEKASRDPCPHIWLLAVLAAKETWWCLPVCQRVLPPFCLTPPSRTRPVSPLTLKAHPWARAQTSRFTLCCCCLSVQVEINFQNCTWVGPEWQMTSGINGNMEEMNTTFLNSDLTWAVLPSNKKKRPQWCE